MKAREVSFSKAVHAALGRLAILKSLPNKRLAADARERERSDRQIARYAISIIPT